MKTNYKAGDLSKIVASVSPKAVTPLTDSAKSENVFSKKKDKNRKSFSKTPDQKHNAEGSIDIQPGAGKKRKSEITDIGEKMNEKVKSNEETETPKKKKKKKSRGKKGGNTVEGNTANVSSLSGQEEKDGNLKKNTEKESDSKKKKKKRKSFGFYRRLERKKTKGKGDKALQDNDDHNEGDSSRVNTKKQKPNEPKADNTHLSVSKERKRKLKEGSVSVPVSDRKKIKLREEKPSSSSSSDDDDDTVSSSVHNVNGSDDKNDEIIKSGEDESSEKGDDESDDSDSDDDSEGEGKLEVNDNDDSDSDDEKEGEEKAKDDDDSDDEKEGKEKAKDDDDSDSDESEDDLSYKKDPDMLFNEENESTDDSDEEEKTEEERKSKNSKVQSEGFCPPEGIVHESLKKKGEKRKPDSEDTTEDASPAKKLKQDDATKKEKGTRPRKDRLAKSSNDRTIFVGNLSVKTERKQLAKLFSKFGEIESSRLRTVPVNDPKLPKKVIAIQKNFHPKRNNLNGYVCFKTAESAKKALAMNGAEVDGLHIRVDMVGRSTNKDPKRSVFVGNLPLDIEEEAVRKHFEDCGDIENVRIVRDKRTCLGKGFGFVTFQDSDGVSFAMKLKESKLKGRKLRIETCVEGKKESDQKSDKGGKNRQKVDVSPQMKGSAKSKSAVSEKKKKKKKKQQTTPSNAIKNPFQSEKDEHEKEKRKEKKQKSAKSIAKDNLKNDIEKILKEGQTEMDKKKENNDNKTPKHKKFGDESSNKSVQKKDAKFGQGSPFGSKKSEKKSFSKSFDSTKKPFEKKGGNFSKKPDFSRSFDNSPQKSMFGISISEKKGKHIKFN